jgi:hypothetical protein
VLVMVFFDVVNFTQFQGITAHNFDADPGFRAVQWCDWIRHWLPAIGIRDNSVYL